MIARFNLQELQDFEKRIEQRLNSLTERGLFSSAGLLVSNSTNSPMLLSGKGAPVLPSAPGSLYLRTDGGSGTTLYVFENGMWVSK